MAWRQRLFEMTSDELIDSVRLSTVALSDEKILHRGRETVEGRLRSSGLTLFLMHPLWGYLSLGMRDVRASPPPVPKDAERRVMNRAHAKAYKEWKDAEEARRKRKGLEHDKLEKCHRQQRRDGLRVELSSSPSSTDSSSDDDESEAGRGPLDHLPDVRGTAPGASKRQAEAPALAPHKALKVSTNSTAQWVVEAQATIQRGTALARADSKEPIAQEEAIEAAMKQAGEEAPMPREAGVLELSEAKAPSIAEATEGEAEAPRTSEAEVVEARASRASEAEVADIEVPRTTEAEVVEAGALGTTEAEAVEASLGTAELAAQDAETEAGQALVPPPVQDPPPS
ncbi:uncharacterized protein [Miscanthus floridulus]|uniref:uncharacterized protein n=1 Tax=Miscanthus floridulus TaxID=154761 RepID=UPI00345A336F